MVVVVPGAAAEVVGASVVMVEVDETDVRVEPSIVVVAATPPEQEVNTKTATQRRILPP
jgi:homoserine kinase